MAELWAHNAAFDGCYFLTRGLPFPGTSLDCSADLVAFLGSPRSLAGAAKHLLGKEVSKDLRDKMKGRPWHSLSADEQEAIRQYALRDSEIALELVTRYAGRWPADEMELSRHTREMGWHGVCIDCDKLDDFTERCQRICEEALPEIPWQGGDPDGDCYPLSLPRAREHCRALGIDGAGKFLGKIRSLPTMGNALRSAIPVCCGNPAVSESPFHATKARSDGAPHHARWPHELFAPIRRRSYLALGGRQRAESAKPEKGALSWDADPRADHRAGR